MTRNTRHLLALGLLLTAIGSPAETVYVTDILQLAMHEEENGQGGLVRNLPSGTELEVLERKNYYVRVRTKDGSKGWTKAAFLVSDKPARSQLAELQALNTTLQGQLEATRDELSTASTSLSELREQTTSSTAEADKTKALVARLRDENEAFQTRLAVYKGSIPWRWSLGAALATLLLGFIGGIAWFDYRSRRRHGGYRIY